MAFFSPAEGIGLVNQTTMAHLQELASRVSTTGLVCAAELSRSRPQWESWIVASTKRRAIYTMYLFNSIFNTVNSVPVYIAEELRGLPAPASKVLWEACTRSIWEREYDHHLSIWEGEELYISELWRSPETGSPERRKRIDRWVQSVDEFGMMMFAVYREYELGEMNGPDRSIRSVGVKPFVYLV
ncbi:MAG: hypothetical protein M1834_004746 [Cirrosporium novae-zelandiae]|nr:MAG: hypothetical protein M1834_004746 [Cirrosporium novae-zelandiae]